MTVSGPGRQGALQARTGLSETAEAPGVGHRGGALLVRKAAQPFILGGRELEMITLQRQFITKYFYISCLI